MQYVFSLTGADFSHGILAAIPVRRADKRKNAIHYHVLISQEGLLREGLQTMLRRAWFEQGVY